MGGLLKGLLGGAPKDNSAQIMAQQKADAEKRAADEAASAARAEAASDDKKMKALQDSEAKRRAFVSQLDTLDDPEAAKKRFLEGIR
jgi:hypothetical protein